MFEQQYWELVKKILKVGEFRKVRNGLTKSVFGETLVADETAFHFPILTLRKMHINGILGELAAMLRKPKHVDDFKKWGCNYWEKWADADGSLRLDYGNSWMNWNDQAIDQMQRVIDKIKTDPTDRRLLVSGWNPSNLDSLSLPCCHILYQWYVRDGKYLDMMWYQRSADLMIGTPSNMVFASLWNSLIANETNLTPGKIVMNIGDVHIYSEHLEQAIELSKQNFICSPVRYNLNMPKGQKTVDFEPKQFELGEYNFLKTANFELKA